MVQWEHFYPDGPYFCYDDQFFKPSTDSFALAFFAAPRRGERVCDLGSGTGLLGLLLLTRERSLSLVCVEQNAGAMALAEAAFRKNGWAGQAELRCGDLRCHDTLPPAGSMDYVISNPPYFAVGSGASASLPVRRTAREESGCTLDELCAAAARVLRWGGRFALVHRSERLTDVLCAMRTHGMEPKRLRFLTKSAQAAPSLFLVEGRRGGNAGLIVEPPLIVGTPEWDAVYFRT